MATRTRKNSAAIAESVDTAPAVDTAPVEAVDTVTPGVGIPTPEPTDTPTDTAPAESDTPTESTESTESDPTAPDTLSYVVDGVTHTVDPDRLETLAVSVGAGRAARHTRALTVGRFIADYAGMNPNRAHGMLTRSGHYVHRDTVYSAAHAYSVSAEFTPADTLADIASILADTLSLVEAVGIRKIRGTHNNVSVIGYDTLSALTDPTDRETEFGAAVRAALEAARSVGMPVESDPVTPTEPTEPTDPTDPAESDPAPVDIPAMWAAALADIAAGILTAGALTGPQRAALAESAAAVLSALADTADSVDRPDPVDTVGTQALTPAPAIAPAADRARIETDRVRAAESAAA